MTDEIKALARRMPTRYLRTFFAEKDIPEVMWTLHDVDGTPHIMSNVTVVEHITLTSKDEAKKLEDVFRRLDYMNADINHFLKHLAGALINIPDPRAHNPSTMRVGELVRSLKF